MKRRSGHRIAAAAGAAFLTVAAYPVAAVDSRGWIRAQPLFASGSPRLRPPRSQATSLHAKDEIIVSELGNGSIDTRFLLEVKLGGQSLFVVPDTGSFGLVVSSRRCAAEDCPIRAYDSGSSSTYEVVDGHKEVNYLSGGVVLDGARDEMKLFDEPKRQLFWEITELGGQMLELYKRVAFEGVLGLPWVETVPGKGSLNETTVLENFGVQAFTVCLGRTTMKPHFEGVDISPSFIYWAPPGSLGWPSTTYVDVVGKEHWTVKLTNFAVRYRDDGIFRQFACYGGLPCNALVDTGSKICTLPRQDMVALTAQIGKVETDCSNYDRLPDLHFQLGDGFNVTMPRAAYVKRSEYSLHSKEEVQLSCMLLFDVNDVVVDGTPVWILGTPFFQEHVVEFDRSRRPARVGISPHPGASDASGECPSQPPTKPAAPAALLRNSGQSRGAGRRKRQLAENQREDDEAADALSLFGLDSATSSHVSSGSAARVPLL